MSICNIIIHQIIRAVQKPQVYNKQCIIMQHVLEHILFSSAGTSSIFTVSHLLKNKAMLLWGFAIGSPSKNFYITILQTSSIRQKLTYNLCFAAFERCTISTTVRPVRQTDMQYSPRTSKCKV